MAWESGTLKPGSGGIDLEALSSHEKLVFQIQEARLQAEAEKAAIDDLMRTSKIKDKELQVLRREERGLGLIRARQEKEKCMNELVSSNARLQDESQKTIKTRKQLQEIEEEQQLLGQKIAEEAAVVIVLKSKRFEAERELDTIKVAFRKAFTDQQARRGFIEVEVAKVEEQLELDARIRQKLSSLRSFAEERIDVIKELLEKEHTFTEKARSSIGRAIDRL